MYPAISMRGCTAKTAMDKSLVLTLLRGSEGRGRRQVILSPVSHRRICIFGDLLPISMSWSWRPHRFRRRNAFSPSPSESPSRSNLRIFSKMVTWKPVGQYEDIRMFDENESTLVVHGHGCSAASQPGTNDDDYSRTVSHSVHVEGEKMDWGAYREAGLAAVDLRAGKMPLRFRS